MFSCTSYIQAFTILRRGLLLRAFTLVEMLLALLIVSVILSASMPIITSRSKAQSQNISKYSPLPIGAIIMWKANGALPDLTWLEANGQALPNGIEYEEIRRIYGSRLPDLRGADSEFYTNLNNYLSIDIKDYLQSVIKPIPKNGIIIWGTNAAIPEGWSETSEYRGVFLRGYGTITHTQNNGSTIGNTATTHSSAAIGAVQGDAIRNITGSTNVIHVAPLGGNSGWTGALGTLVYGYSAANAGNSGSAAAFNIDVSKVTPVTNEIRPVNKAVRYIKYTNSPTLPNMPEPPGYTQRFRYIIKVRH